MKKGILYLNKYQTVYTRLPYHFARFEQDVKRLQKRFPMLQVNIIGYSCLCKPLYELKVGKGKKKVHFNASFHANEWITSLVLMKWFEELLVTEYVQKDGTINESAAVFLLDSEISLVPMVNPDGVDLVIAAVPNDWQSYCKSINGSTDFSGWKANIRGVDLNNQFPANWEIEKERKIPKAPASRDFPGNKPLTEPEARALVDLTTREQFDRVFALHTQGREFYWGYQHYHPKESAFLAEKFEKISGYKSVQHVDSHAGYRDWFVYTFRKPGFTLELGEGVNPLPLEQFDTIFQDVSPLLTAGIYL